MWPVTAVFHNFRLQCGMLPWSNQLVESVALCDSNNIKTVY